VRPDAAAAHLLIHGRVQGVGFRFFVQDEAVELGLLGWVRNLPDGGVEAFAQGPKNAVEQWIEQLRQGPPLGRVEQMEITWSTLQTPTDSFRIIG